MTSPVTNEAIARGTITLRATDSIPRSARRSWFLLAVVRHREPVAVTARISFPEPTGEAVAHSTQRPRCSPTSAAHRQPRSEEHTSELQSRLHLVCRLLLEKKKK